MAAEKQDDDLPLMSNVHDMLVHHYNFSFKCDFQSKCFACCAVLFLEAVNGDQDFKCNSCSFDTTPAVEHGFKNCSVDNKVLDDCDKVACQKDISNQRHFNFVLVLDCHKIIVHKVEGLYFSDDTHRTLKISKPQLNLLTVGDELQFSVNDWSLKIWKNGDICKFCFPNIIRISYETVPSCPSLLWVKDQEGNPAVFSYGASINNRALFPCQEPPVAMATWEATVSVSDNMTVLMSGDEEPQISHSDGFSHYYFNTRKALPLSTFCLAVGSWKEHVITSEYKAGTKCRIFACSTLLERSVKEFSNYIPFCMKNSEELLGTYPFSRIDFLIVPSSFGSLGMASPNLIFLSQSLLAGDGCLCSRVSHEVSHGWFGLSVGALDWTEEWLSEGFATFVEDVIHAKTNNMGSEDGKEYMELKAFIRKKTLTDEIKSTNSELQILRPSFGEVEQSVIDGVNATILKNGQNPMKNFIQVHYIKGYFLLKYLCDTIGLDSFMDFLRIYVKKYESQLVTSKEFLTLFFSTFPNLKNIVTFERIYDEWLHNSGIASEIENLKPSSENKLYRTVLEETEKWNKLNSVFSKKRSKRRKLDLTDMPFLTSEQIVLLLENLLDEDRLNNHLLKCLDQAFHFNNLNAEVQHRWFELVVKYKYKSEYPSLKSFLTDHMAMGVYLYGEMIYTSDNLLNTMAHEVYLSLKAEMEPSYRSTIDQMFLDSV